MTAHGEWTPERLVEEAPRIIGGGPRYWTDFTLEHIAKLLPLYAVTITDLKGKLARAEDDYRTDLATLRTNAATSIHDIGVRAESAEQENKRLRECLKECADDLEQHVEAYYAKTKDHPSEARRYKRDIEPVVNARAALKPVTG